MLSAAPFRGYASRETWFYRAHAHGMVCHRFPSTPSDVNRIRPVEPMLPKVGLPIFLSRLAVMVNLLRSIAPARRERPLDFSPTSAAAKPRQDCEAGYRRPTRDFGRGHGLQWDLGTRFWRLERWA